MGEIFIGALPYRMTEQDLRDLLEPIGSVKSVEIHADWEQPTFEPYACVEMDNAPEAVQKLDGKKIRATHLRVQGRQS